MNVERMSFSQRATWHAALADVARVEIVDHLSLSDRSPSELQSSLALPSNLLSHHLKVLEEAGIVARRRSDGDRRRTYLTLADRRAAESARDPLEVHRVVFVCSANSARSQLAAAALRSAGGVEALSAGTHPAERIAPGALEVAARNGLVLDDLPTSIESIRQDDDFVIAVCDQAYEELAGDVALHWSLPDPVPLGTADAFDQAFRSITSRIDGLLPHLVHEKSQS